MAITDWHQMPQQKGLRCCPAELSSITVWRFRPLKSGEGKESTSSAASQQGTATTAAHAANAGGSFQ